MTVQSQAPAHIQRRWFRGYRSQPQDGAPAKAAVSNGRAPAARLQIPERPRLAPGVNLAGPMRESAFKNPPWLLERDGAGYVQVTELLYRIAEHCDGERTLDDIAAAVSEATGRGVSTDNVRLLMAKQLIPKGFVAGADGSVAAVSGGGARSPLAVNMKMKAFSPRVIDPIVKVLRVLYWPPVLIAVLLAALVAESWLYLEHGVGNSIHDLLYTPAYMLVAIGAIVLSAGFHELGHGAALRYAGGRVKGMGAGIYLVYPAFYTDVSDNYRLPRWARVRTDLGGFYFNLIFALGLMGLYVLTGQQVLLLIVLLVNFEIFHQLLPFVRLDGYWTLADITGIPDFFSQMGAFIRSLLHIPGWQGRKLPELKWWAKAIFIAYMLTTIPVLGFFLFTMVKGVPRILATAVDSFWQQAGTFSQAQATGQWLAMAAAVVQMAFLALPVFGILFTLYSLGRKLATAVWKWSKPTPQRRLAGSLGTLALAGLIAYLWAPQLPVLGLNGPLHAHWSLQPIRKDERGTLFDAATVASNVPVPSLGQGTPACVTVAEAVDYASGAAVPENLSPELRQLITNSKAQLEAVRSNPDGRLPEASACFDASIVTQLQALLAVQNAPAADADGIRAEATAVPTMGPTADSLAVPTTQRSETVAPTPGSRGTAAPVLEPGAGSAARPGSASTATDEQAAPASSESPVPAPAAVTPAPSTTPALAPSTRTAPTPTTYRRATGTPAAPTATPVTQGEAQ